MLSFGTLHVRGQGSGAEADVPTAALLTFREGRVVSLKDYGDRAEALAAAGLAE